MDMNRTRIRFYVHYLIQTCRFVAQIKQVLHLYQWIMIVKDNRNEMLYGI